MSVAETPDIDFDIRDFIGIYDGALSGDICDKIIRVFEENSEKYLFGGHKVCNERKTKEIRDTDSDLRVISEQIITRAGRSDVEFDSVLSSLQTCFSHYQDYFANAVGSAPYISEHFKIQKTEPTQGYHVWHEERNIGLDFLFRQIVWTIYLNDVEEGGETEFLYLSRRVKPKKGMLMLFPAGWTHLHRGNPPLTDTKYIMTGWFEKRIA